MHEWRDTRLVSLFECFDWELTGNAWYIGSTELERQRAADREREKSGDRRVVGGIYW